jgi:hypothetical protein
MTLAQLETLEEAIDDALDAMKGGSTRDVVNWIRMNRRRTFDDNLETLGAEGLEARIRVRRKKRRPEQAARSSENLCLDFGLPEMELDTEISIPRDMENLLYGACDWKEPDDASLRDIDKHIQLLKVQGHLALERARSWGLVRQAAARFAHGNFDLTLGELRQIAREHQ